MIIGQSPLFPRAAGNGRGETQKPCYNGGKRRYFQLSPFLTGERGEERNRFGEICGRLSLTEAVPLYKIEGINREYGNGGNSMGSTLGLMNMFYPICCISRFSMVSGSDGI